MSGDLRAAGEEPLQAYADAQERDADRRAVTNGGGEAVLLEERGGGEVADAGEDDLVGAGERRAGSSVATQSALTEFSAFITEVRLPAL